MLTHSHYKYKPLQIAMVLQFKPTFIFIIQLPPPR